MNAYLKTISFVLIIIAGLEGYGQEIFKAAITAEKDSIAFYVGLKESVSQKAGKDRIDAIIRQEYNHIVILSEKLINLI